MIYFLAFMQAMFGRFYPLFASAVFAACAAYYAIYNDSPYKFDLVLLAFSASLGWLSLHGAETILFRVVETMENASKALEKILQQSKE